MEMNTDLRSRSIDLLAEGFKYDFLNYVLESSQYNELMMELADEFVEKYIPVRGEQNRTDMAFELVNRTRLKAS